MAEEDRISNLPDEIIHHILSFIDLKYAMQTSALSKKWKLIWTLLPQLSLDSFKFSDMSHFNKFVKHVLLHRNNDKEVSVLQLRSRGVATHSSVASIVRYARFHNVRRLNIVWCRTTTRKNVFSEFVFSCRSLEDLTLAVEDRTSRSTRSYISTSAWDLPNLEKLNLKNFQLDNRNNMRINLFSKCVNLKDLSLCEIDMYGLVELNLCVPQLSNLSVTSCYGYPKVLNVVAPQLQNLTASVDFVDALHRSDLLQKSAGGFDSLEKVNLSWLETHYVSEKKTLLSKLLGVFQKLYSAKFLVLDAYVIMVLSSCLDQLLLEPCPFNKLKCLKINTMLVAKYGWSPGKREQFLNQLKNYFLDKSPSATFITDYPQKVHDDDNAMANKLAMSESEIKQLDTLSKEKRLLEAKILMQDPNTVAEEKGMLDANRRRQDEVISKQEAMVEANIQMQEQAFTKQKAMFEAKVQMQDQVITKQKVPQKRSSQQVHDDDATAKKMAKSDLETQPPPVDTIITRENEMLDLEKQPAADTNIITQEKEMLDANIQMQDEAITKQKLMFEAKIQMQEQAITKQKAMFEAKLQMQDQVITKQKLMFEAKIQMLDQVSTSQKAMLEAKIQFQDTVIAEHKAKIQVQDNVIADHKAKIQMLDEAKLDQDKLISYVIKSKIAELKLQVESGNPDFEVIRSIGSDVKSVTEMIPESLKVVMDAQISFEYVQLKSLFLSHIDACQWSNIETELGIINGF